MKQRKGLSLIEAVVAVSSCIILLVATLTMIVNATNSSNENKDYFIGKMLADDGARAMQSIVYANIVRFGEYYAEDCAFAWPDYFPAADEPVDCTDPANIIVDDFYTVDKFKSGQPLNWQLNRISLPLFDNDVLNEGYRLYLRQICSPITSECVEAYTSDSVTTEPTKYYRQIDVNFVDALQIEVLSNVSWKLDSGKLRTITATKNINFPAQL